MVPGGPGGTQPVMQAQHVTVAGGMQLGETQGWLEAHSWAWHGRYAWHKVATVQLLAGCPHSLTEFAESMTKASWFGVGESSGELGHSPLLAG